MKKNKIEHFAGHARVLKGNQVEITAADKQSNVLDASHIILATGARPRSVPGVTIDRQRVITSTEAMSLATQPESMLIVGAGAIGVEFAYFYNAIGTKVTIVEMLPTVLPVEDLEITKLMETSLRRQGIEILTGTRVEKVIPTPSGVDAEVTTPEGRKKLHGTVALIAVGVQGNVEGIGLEENAVKIEKGHIKVDADYRTSAAGIYAIGDVIGPPWLAHVASAEGIHCVEAIAGKKPEPLDYLSIPGCTYCQPQVASVGLTEEKAKAAGHELKIGKFPFKPLGKAVAIGETDGLVKLIFDAKYGELLGAHIMGSEATEMIAELAIAKRLESTGKEIFGTVHAHPTLSEAVMEAAAAAYGEAINI
jgi:dihydrolipoamide dehydrogenase